MGPDALLERARAARNHAYAPYSGLHVGAALEADDGTIHTGCNVENASHPLAICAEQSALAAAVVAGCRRFRTLALSTSASDPVPPCGGCRQVLAEFALDLRVYSESAGGLRTEWSLADLLPEPFLSPRTGELYGRE